MRTFTRLFGLGCGALVIAIAARYGFKTSDNDFDGAIWAFTYGAVTLGWAVRPLPWRARLAEFQACWGACLRGKRACLAD